MRKVKKRGTARRGKKKHSNKNKTGAGLSGITELRSAVSKKIHAEKLIKQFTAAAKKVKGFLEKQEARACVAHNKKIRSLALRKISALKKKI